MPLALKLKSLGAQADDLEALLHAVKRVVRIPAHDDVIRQTDTPEQVKALVAGTTCAYKRREDGGRTIISFQHPGDFCDISRYVLPDLGTGIGIQALTDCTMALIDYQDMDRLLSRPALASTFWRASMLEAAIYRERLSRTGRGTALERVAHLLCEQLARRETIGLHALRLPLSQVDVADAAGLSVVHVNRIIQTLRGLHVLSKGSHAIDVIDRTQLEKIARFDGRYLNLSSKWPCR